MIGLKGLDCQICIDDLKKHKDQIKGLKSLNVFDSVLTVEGSGEVDDLTLVNNISDHLKHVGHNHKIAMASNEIIYLRGLTCPNCTAKIISGIESMDNVELAEFNIATEKLSVWYDENLDSDKLYNSVKKIVDKYEPDVVVEKDEDFTRPEVFEDKKSDIIKMALVFLALIVSQFVPMAKELSFAILIVAYLVIGKEVLIEAFENIKEGEIFDENFLMSLASIGAIAIGQAAEGVAVMLFYSLGEFFEDLALENSRTSIKNALDLKAQYANLKSGDDVKEVDPNDVKVGDIIVIKPGEKVPLDGVVVSGESLMDTSNITGESIPVFVKENDEVSSGYINKNSLVELRVTKEFSDSTVAKIIDLVENASSRKAKTEKIITKFAKIYTPIVVFSAIAIVIISQAFNLLTISQGIYRALTFLVISCPCAFVISVPLTVFAGIGAASKSGIFVKGGNYLESLSKVDHVLMDKTGTITKGVFEVVSVEPVGVDEDKFLKYAYLGEKNSTHPIARSIVAYAESKGFKGNLSDFQEIQGKGIKYNLDGNTIFVGNKGLLEGEGIEIPKKNFYGVNVHLAENDKYIGTISLNDSLKENVIPVIKKLKKFGIKITLLSGDKSENVKEVAERIEVDSYFGGLLPQDKVAKLEEAKKSNVGNVVFVGDGVNDAPVLAGADIGVAMGALGSDSAIEAADIVLMTDDIGKLYEGIQISKRTNKIVFQNIGFALGVKVLFLILGSLGIAGMWSAVFADVGVTLLAVLNSMRALKYRK
ncbi:heavy metal translocating P-type ATPase [Peptoniphilus catoniae]|uniref:heavy metal translocating P-type ATPase n=1 Tax=Peptoniphilus catoniae TaxID=1660341 RepID=UPI0010FE817C|nr:heavy metal translocating P-type ATPase [Peptoniphilus catoniae]